MKIGFIGLGTMGYGMAMNIHNKCEDELIVYSTNLSKLKSFADIGVTTVSELSDICMADVIMLSLPDTVVVKKIVESLKPYFNEGCIVVDLSTISYTDTLAMASGLEEKDVFFIDSPVSGMKARADNGTLTTMCGGNIEAFEKVKPYLECFSTKVLYMGKSGNGQLTKLINQLLFDINIAALAEILPMSKKLGLDTQKVGDVINTGTGRSYASEFFIPHILNNSFDNGYPMGSAYKDLISASEIGFKYAIPMPVLAAASSTYQMALCKGLGNNDKGGMIKVFEDLLNIEYRSE